MRTRPAVLGLLIATLAACTSFQIRVAHDPSVDPSAFRSWSWLPAALMTPADQWLPDQYFDRRVRQQVAQILDDKGYQEEAADRAGFYVNYRLITDDVTGADRPYGYAYGFAWVRADRITPDSYQRGTFIIDIVDASTK